MEMKFKRFLSLLLALTLVLSYVPVGAFATETGDENTIVSNETPNEPSPETPSETPDGDAEIELIADEPTVKTVATEAELAAALAEGGDIKLETQKMGDMYMPLNVTSILTVPADKTVNLDLNGITVVLNDKYLVNEGTLTVKNGTMSAGIFNDTTNGAAIYNKGTLVVDGANVSGVCAAIRTESGKVTINSGTISATENSGKTAALLRVKGGEVVIHGGTFVGCNSTNGNEGCLLFNVSGGSVVVNGGHFSDFAGQTMPSYAQYVTISAGTFVPGTTDGWSLAHCLEGSLAPGYAVNEDGIVYEIPPQGNDFTGYMNETAIWGEVWGNALTSFVIKVLDANGNVMGTTSLNNIDGIIDGDVNVTWNLKLDAASNTDEYWTMNWTNAPSLTNVPTAVELWVDGIKVSGGNVVMNGPDNLHPVFAAKVDDSGKILSYIACDGFDLSNASAKLQSAINAGDHVAILTAGTYAVPTGKNCTITGAVEGVEFDNIGNCGMGGASVTFNNVTFNYAANSTYKGLQHSGNMVYNNCTFNGQVFLYGQSETFNNCTFNNTGDNYNVWTYGAKAVEFNGCTFNCDGKAVLVYNEGACATELEVVDTDFIASAPVDGDATGKGKAAIEIDTSLMPSGTVIDVDAATTATNFSTNTLSESSLWHDKKVDTTNKNGGGTTSTVIVNDVTVKYPVMNFMVGEAYYSTLETAAAAAAQSGEAIKLLADITVTEEVSLNGITLTTGEFTLTNNGTINFTDCKLENAVITGTGSAKFYGNINFYGDNQVLSTVDGGPFELIVNKGATLLISRFVLGYNRNITVYGEIEDAHSFDPEGKTPSLQFNSSSGVSVGGNGTGNLTVVDAYVELGNSSWKNAQGTYEWNFKNSYVSATSFTDNKTGYTEDAAWNVTFDDSVLAAKNYIKNGVGATYNFTNGSVATTGSMKIDGVLNIDATSSVTANAQQNNKHGAASEHEDINGTVNVAGTLNIGGNSYLEVLTGELNVNGGTVNITSAKPLHIAADGNVNVNGGTITGDVDVSGNLTSNGNISGKITKTADNAKISISGGIYTQDVSAWCANGYIAVDNGDGTFKVKSEREAWILRDGVIKYYGTLAEAVADAKDGETIILQANVEIAEVITIDKNITIGDYGNLTITPAGEGAFYLKGAAQLTLNNLIVKETPVFTDNSETGAAINGQVVTGVVTQKSSVSYDGTTVTVVNPAWVAKIGTTYYMSINEALTAAQPGDEVVIFAGEYTQSITVNKAITVIGETDAEGNNLVKINGGISITANGAAVKNLTASNPAASGYNMTLHISAGDVLVEGCEITDHNAVRYSTAKGKVTFKDSVLTGDVYGIHFDGATGGEIVIDNCVITGWTSFASTIKKVTMTDTTFAEGTYNYVRFYQDAEISGCTFNEKMSVDVSNDVSATVTVTNSTVENGNVEDLFEGKDIINSTVTVDGEKLVRVARVASKYFETVEEAFAAVQNGGTIELYADVTMQDAYDVNNFELNIIGSGKLTLNDKLTVSGESILNISAPMAGEVILNNGAILKDSTISGNVFVAGKVIFRGDNTVNMLYDYGTLTDYYGTVANMEWSVEPGASLTMAAKARYGLGYGDNITIKGELTDAMTARDTLTKEDASFFTHGLVAQESKGWNCDSSLTVEDAYVIIGENNSFGNKPGNYGGTYTFNFENTVLDASRITFYEALSTTEFNLTGTDAKVGQFMIRDKDSVFTLTDSKLLSTSTVNGNDEGNYIAGKLVLANSELTYSIAMVMEDGTIEMDLNSSITAPAIKGAGKIVIDATGFNGAAAKLVAADLSEFTGEVEVIGAAYKVTNDGIVIEGAVASIGDAMYATLAEAIANVKNGETIELLAAIDEDVTVVQAPDVKITIDGKGNTFSGTITVDGKSAAYATAGLTIKNVKFDATDISKDASINLGGSNTTRYTSNVSVIDCSFAGEGQTKVGIKSYTGGCKNLSVTGCSATGMHSLMQLYKTTGLVIDNCTVTESKNGISVRSSEGTITNCTIDVDGYGVRADGDSVSTLTVSGNTIDAAKPVIVRKTTADGYKLAVDGNTLTAPDGEYQVIITKGDDEAALADPSCKFVFEGNTDDLSVYPCDLYVAEVNGKGYMTINEALTAAQPGDTVVIFAGTYAQGLSVTKAITVIGENDAEGNNLVNFNGKLSITGNGATVKGLNFSNPTGNAGVVDAKDVLVEDCTVVGSNGFRYCYTSGTVTFKDSTITGAVYGIHFDGKGGEIVIDNCVITGWTSFAASINKVTMTDTTFAEGNYNYIRFYQDADIDNCTFNEKMSVDVSNDVSATVKVTDSTVVNGNVEELFSAADIDKSDIYVDGERLITPAAEINGVAYDTFEAALNAVQDGETIVLLDVKEDESGKEIDFTKEIEFTITGNAPEFALPVITFQNATVNIKDAEILIPELDARQNATINVINSTVHDAGGNSIAKSYYNGAINISGNSVVYMMQVTTMGYITLSDTAVLNATWQTNVYGNGMITIEDSAVFNTAALHLVGKDYSGRDNTDADRVGKPAAIIVDGATVNVGKVYSDNGADYSYNSSKGVNIGTIDGKSAVLDIKNGAAFNIYLADGETANIGADGTVNVDGTVTVSCRKDGGSATLVNDGSIVVNTIESAVIANECGNVTGADVADYKLGYVDGAYKLVPKEYVAQIGDLKFEHLSEALAAVQAGENTITLLAAIDEDVVIEQVEGVNITIDGNGNVYTGTMEIYGHARYNGEETLTIKNVKFETSEAKHDFITCNTTESVKRYAHNVTVEDCSFTATGAAVNSAVGLRLRQCYDILVKNSTATGLHSLIQATGGNTMVIDTVTVDGCKNGIAAGTTDGVTVKNSTINVTGYGIRADGNAASDMTVSGNTITAAQPVVVRRTTAAYDLTVTGNTLNAPDGAYQVVITEGEDDKAYVNPTGAFALESDVDTNKIYPAAACAAQVGDYSYTSVEAALEAAENDDTVIILKDLTVENTIVVTKSVTIDLNGQTLTGSCNPVIRVKEANVTVQGGKIVNNEGYCFIVGSTDASGELTIKDGNFRASTTVASVTKGHLTIEGGYFAVDAYSGEGYENYNFLLNCIDAYYKTGEAGITVKGGSFENFNPADNAAEGLGTNFVDPLYEATTTNGVVWNVNAYGAGEIPENPIYVEWIWNDEMTEATATVSVPANATYYFAAYGMNGTVLTVNGEELEYVPGFMFFTPATFEITNGDAAEATYELKISYPIGSQNNPAELVIGDNTAAIEAGNDQGYFFGWTAEEDGTLIITMPEGDWMYVINNMTSYVYGDMQWSDSDPVVNPVAVEVAAGDEIQVVVNSYDPANMWSNPAADITFTAEFNNANNLFFVEWNWNEAQTEATANITVPAGATLYYGAYVSGMELTINGESAGMLNGSRWMPASFTVANDDETAATYELKISYPVGTQGNPAELVIGDNTASIEAGNDQGYFFTWTAPAAGMLTITMPEGDWMYVINNMTSYIYGDMQWSDSDPVVNPAVLHVAEGDELQIVVNSYDPASWNNPAAELVINAAFAGDEQNPIMVDWVWNDEQTEATATVEVGANATYYYSAYVSGMELTINGEPAGMLNGSRWMPAIFTVTNDSDAVATFDLKITYPVGNMSNPAELVIGDNTATIEAGNSQGYWFTWTAAEDGVLVITMPEGDWMYVINNMTSYIYGDTQWSDSDPVVNPAYVNVAAGNEIQIMVSTYDPNAWEAPAGTVVFDADFWVPVAQNKETGKVYGTVADAMAEAKSGETVILTADVTEDMLYVRVGRSLDLNGYVLTVNDVVAVNNANVVDNSTANTGMLVVNSDNVMISRENAQLPVWNGTGYIFTTVDLTRARIDNVTEDSFRFAFQPRMLDAAKALLADGANDNDVTIEARVSWETEMGREYRNLVFNETQISTVIPSANGAFLLTFSGFQGLDIEGEILVEAVVYSGTGVVYASTGLTVNVG